MISDFEKNAIDQINAYVKEAHAALDKAVQLSNETLIPFDWDLSYGMSGSYQPKRPVMTRREALDLILEGKPVTSHQKEWLNDIISSTEMEDDSWQSSDDEYHEGGWISSSQYCR